MAKTEAVLFDAYGTIVDVGTYHRDISTHAVKQLSEFFGISAPAEEFNAYWNQEFERAFRDVIAYCGEFRNMRDLYGISARNVFRRYGVNVPDAYVKELNGVFKKMLDEAVIILPNVTTTLEKLYTHGCRLGIVSNGDTEELSAHVNSVSDLFDVIITSEELGVYKPHSRLFNEAIRKMDVGRDATPFVGDTLTSDVLGAKKAGLTAIWYNKKQRTPKPEIRPDFEVRDMAEILEIVDLNASDPDRD
jgi:2-haloacid dehalogenase